MADDGKKTWSGFKLNVLVGCSLVSAGCKHCSAACQVWRQALCPTSSFFAPLVKSTKDNGPAWTGKILYRPELLKTAYKLSGQYIWVAPMSDPFHPDVTLEMLAEIYEAIVRRPQNTFQILTKRIERMHQLYTDGSLKRAIEERMHCRIRWPLSNTWEGTSVESNTYAKERLGLLLDMPSGFRFISAQPLLDYVDLTPFLTKKKVDYVIVGAEAGPVARPANPEHILDVRQQLQRLKVPHLVKCYPL
jgi:protein gp37